MKVYDVVSKIRVASNVPVIVTVINKTTLQSEVTEISGWQLFSPERGVWPMTATVLTMEARADGFIIYAQIR